MTKINKIRNEYRKVKNDIKAIQKSWDSKQLYMNKMDNVV